MSLRLPDKWIWDSWFVRDGDTFHVFYLHASRALGNADLRHVHPIVGHATSTDLTNWTVVRDALIVSEPPAFDDFTTWTGSVVRDDDGLWWMFYTGTDSVGRGARQTIGAATSRDLMTWNKLSTTAMVTADPRWYREYDRDGDQAWRDPWVFRFPGDPEWHMLITAQSKDAPEDDRGVMAHATSPNLHDWTVQPPLSSPGAGFDHLEVFQFEVVDGVPVVLFCCDLDKLRGDRRVSGDGVFSCVVNADLSDIDFRKTVLFDDTIYAARLVQDHSGDWFLIGFINYRDGEFVGELSDPIPVTADPVLGIVRR
jgi:beta-fructofuranosidase